MSKYFYVDIESTGTDLKKDRIIQIAFIEVDNSSRDIKIFNDLCYTDLQMSYDAMGIHHITPNMLEDKYWPYETDAFIELEKENSTNNYFISHGNELDIAMLGNEELYIKMQCIDTDRCARHLLKDAENYKLQTLRYQYGIYKSENEEAKKIGIEKLNAHDALSDAFWCYMLTKILLKMVDGNYQELVELSKKPVLLERVTFGKYKNDDYTFEDLMKNNPGYLVSLYNKLALDWSDLEYTLRYWLKTSPHHWKKAQEERKKLGWQ